METHVRRWTGIAGLSTLVLTLVVMPLHFVHDAAPPVSVAAIRVVVNGFTCLGLLVFLAGLRLLARRDPVAEMAAVVALGSGTVFVAGTLVADSMHLGSALLAGGGVDPTRIGGGAEAAIVLFGPTARLLTAATVAAAGVALARASLVPAPLTVAAYVVALGHLSLVPTAWSGTDPANFYDINGWGVAAAGGLFVMWVALAGARLLRRPAAGAGQVPPTARSTSRSAPAGTDHAVPLES